MKQYILFLKGYFTFAGKSNRKEYWIPTLINRGIQFLIYAIWLGYINYVSTHYSFITSTDINTAKNIILVSNVFSALILIPSWSIAVRRFRDAGLAWYYCFPFVVATDGIALFRLYNNPIVATLFMLMMAYQFVIFLRPTKRE
ncbi:hypothetical protein RD055328_03850 [Companilactobacillus sp. RD055328]|uniref:DUF805 domain-containing protein n=1 Tax=Companilactobacillus sp. RD055328 TaxID=2916634 RepID=UPI001FC89BCF|nr:DUF805 domain-containing protein [Companilactobacillus sp. RD055328]GKQ42462.1 hypothetical protein RD055328_03850 [Companilactobacillus sp. RD055328]